MVNETVKRTLAEMEKRGWVQRPVAESYPDAMPIKMAAKRLKISVWALREKRHEMGLRELPRNKDGIVFCGASVAEWVNRKNGGAS